ncbi:MAG TPA: hypothetical protein VG742_04080 [Dongiaceae bacterium]|nr:hypothetical protein [Dongiaceae bacterium]
MAYLGSATFSNSLAKPRAFFNPWLDFLCLGGGSLIALPILGAVIPDDGMGQVQLAVLLVALIVNFPHFIHSYQVFYGGFAKITQMPGVPSSLRRRYLWSGVTVPAILLGLLVMAVAASEPTLLRYSINAMGFFVGWHYVKQGYGMLMADAAMKRSFFSASTKTCLLINAYVCWALSWLMINDTISERTFHGLSYYTFNVPDGATAIAGAALSLSSLWSLAVLIGHAFRHRAAFPFSGLCAYVASLYVWLFVRYDPEVVAFIPAFHSLQYLYMIWRHRLNMEAAEPDAAVPLSAAGGQMSFNRPHVRFATYVASAIVIGGVAFLMVPAALDAYVPYDHAVFGDHLFMIAIWVFINIHHFFIDNAMWRSGNPHTMTHLFAHR